MKVERFTVQACCGRTSIIFKTDRPLSKEILAQLVSLGFKEAPHFTKAGMLYADNSDFIVTGSFGSDRLQVKCRKADCTQKLNDFEELLLKIG
jgi:Ni,Fe-hydrogenase I small subunit